jgi:hypothetical protein
MLTNRKELTKQRKRLPINPFESYPGMANVVNKCLFIESRCLTNCIKHSSPGTTKEVKEYADLSKEVWPRTECILVSRCCMNRTHKNTRALKITAEAAAAASSQGI